jgi:iron complex outermembrane receptor protein
MRRDGGGGRCRGPLGSLWWAAALDALTPRGDGFVRTARDEARHSFVDPGQPPFDPTFGEQWEGGVKAELLGGRLLATAAVFRLDKTGNLSFPYDPVTGEYDVVQGGLWRSDGLELEVNGRVSRALDISASLTFLDGRVIDDPAYTPGDPLGGAPSRSGSLWVSWRPLARLSLGGGVFHLGDWQPYPGPRNPLPGRTTVDLTGFWSFTPRVGVRVLARNVGDVRSYTDWYGFNNAMPGAPRSIRTALVLAF